MEGELPSRVVRLVKEWAALHQEELMENWNLLHEKKKFIKIEPLAEGNDMILHVTRMENRGDFKVYVEFNDGFKGTIDFKEILANERSEWVRELLNPEMFNTVRLNFFTLCWDNELDFAPEYLYEQVKVKANVA
jgi:hypothetical protein